MRVLEVNADGNVIVVVVAIYVVYIAVPHEENIVRVEILVKNFEGLPDFFGGVSSRAVVPPNDMDI